MNCNIQLARDEKYAITQPRQCTVKSNSTLLMHMYKPVVLNDESQRYTVTTVNVPRHRSKPSEKVLQYLLVNSVNEHYYTEDPGVLMCETSRKFDATDMLDYFESIEHTGFYFPECLYTARILTELVTRCNGAVDPLKEALEPFVQRFPTRRIVAAANRITHESLPNGSLVITSARHYDPLMRSIYTALELKNQGIRNCDSEEGFIDQWGVWVNRVVALAIVKNSGQHFDPKRNGARDELYSEGVW